MPSLIGLNGDTGVNIAGNYRQQQVPFSRFGTRKIAWYAIRHADTRNSGAIDMVKMNILVDAIQTQMEIVTIGAPYISDNWGKFMIAVFDDTAGNGSNTELSDSGQVGYNSNSSTLQDVLRNATGDDVVVERFYLFGAPATDTSDYYGFTNDNAYKEYNSQAGYLGNDGGAEGGPSYVFD